MSRSSALKQTEFHRVSQFIPRVVESRQHAGRPEKHLNKGMLFHLAKMGCTQEEAATMHGMCRRTFIRKLQGDPELNAVWEMGKAHLEYALRKKQMEVALSGNTTMLIWLGKQYLGQRDKPEPKPDMPLHLDEDERAILRRYRIPVLSDVNVSSFHSQPA